MCRPSQPAEPRVPAPHPGTEGTEGEWRFPPRVTSPAGNIPGALALTPAPVGTPGSTPTPGNRAPEGAKWGLAVGMGRPAWKVQPGTTPPSVTQLASLLTDCQLLAWLTGSGEGLFGGDFSSPSDPRSEVLILFPSHVLLCFCWPVSKLELISRRPAHPH